jgi:DNA polymerase-3 subunit gamma/tau
MVYYRAYRPQTIEELDNTSVREKLTAVLSSSNQPHAYLFTGPKGLGKTSSARIVAKVLNCTTDLEKRKNKIEPCNICESCKAITNGSFIDVVEIDGASNRGIDEIRDLKESTRLAPAGGKVKVYIIDEVHMLTTEAFNALLKTLEEPPSHVVFILCTTEVQKIPETVFSRCFQISFTKATGEELKRSFGRIVKGEKLEVDEDGLALIAQFSDGGFRDGAKLLEELVVMSGGKKITKDMVEEKLGLGSFDQLLKDVLTAFDTKDMKKGLNVTKELQTQGVDMRFFMSQLLGRVHDTLMEKVAGSGQPGEIMRLRELLTLLSTVLGEMRTAIIETLPLELALIEWSVEKNTVKRNDTSVDVESTVTVTDEGVTVKSLKKHIGEIEKQKALGKILEEEVVKEERKMDKLEISHAPSSDGVTREWMNTFWKSLISEVNKANRTLAGVLRGCKLGTFADGSMTIETSFSFHKEQLDQPKMQDVLADTAKILVGKPVTISVVLKAK